MTSQELQTSPPKFPWKLATVLYGISFAPQLLSANSLFWDDWVMFDLQTGKLRESQYHGSGNGPWREFIESYLLQSSLPVFRIVSLIAYFFAGYFLFHILKRSKFLHVNQIIAITLIFLVLPVNSARISIVNSKYGIDLFFFYLAWYLYETKSHKLAKSFAFVFFFLSYSTLPFPTFTLLPILYRVMLKSPKNLREILREFAFATPLMLLPIGYLVLRQIYWPPTGGLSGMYTPQILGTARALLFISICSMPLMLHIASIKFKNLKKPNLLITSGCFSLSIAAVPYMVGGHLVDISDWLITFIPNFSDWSSRHQLTIPLGISLIIAGSMKLERPEKLKWNTHPILTTLLAVFVLLNITFAQEYFLDGKKQDSIIAAMADNAGLKNASSILIDDSAVRFNARGRGIRSYEWEAMLEKVFGNNSRKVSYLQYINCAEFQPDAILHISAPNGRLESTLRRHVDINISVEQISPCGN